MGTFLFIPLMPISEPSPGVDPSREVGEVDGDPTNEETMAFPDVPVAIVDLKNLLKKLLFAPPNRILR
eukprot:CAMPEP_0194324398 /NCGR_PEP_ID=MMETSP0171-20130528/27761_1 /TAXON_ID=218684 /ORGANISM="Corethron pennatum, Strain L29A3" /LENGTH=67 /DNA_ID=CAMNT_0039083289 /DNA_START=463 /DNA_END=666 /DNA_ORIENTATION=-